jgi:NADH-quinone oxidoreductase subunit N
MPVLYLPYSEDLLAASPLLLLLVMGLVVMMVDAFGAYKLLPWVTGLGLLASAALAWPGLVTSSGVTIHFSGMLNTGGLASIIHILLCLTGFFSVFFIADNFERHHEHIGEAFSLIIFAVIGMIMLANGNDLITVFIGLEVMSVCLYIMAAVFKKDLRSNEAGLKYFLLGAFATGFLLYGIALVYGMTGTTRLDYVRDVLLNPAKDATLLFYPAIGLLLVGFLFKIAAFPFHAWTPDVYTGAPTPLTGFMATGGKMAAFVALGFMLQNLMPTPDAKVVLVLSLLAIASMVYGNIVASRQSNLKRMLAYSSIAHTGYVLLGICAGPEAYSAVLFYMFIYGIMTIGAFGVISMVEQEDGDADIERWRGLGQRQPWVAIAMSVFLLSLAGVPPMAGFMSKYFVFYSAMNAHLYVAAVIGILASVIGAYYYLRVIVYMFFRSADANEAVQAPAVGLPLVGALLLGVLLLILGIAPSLVSSQLDAFYHAVPAAPTALLGR